MAARPEALHRPGLIADIGGTNARFALSEADGTVRDAVVLACRDFPDLAAAAESFLARIAPPAPPRRAAMAVASPVSGDRVDMTNHSWSFSIDDVRRRLDLDDLRVINDFTAIALAIPHLGDGDRLQVGGGEATPGAPIAVLGPGTGLGVSALIPAGGGWVPLATEGGHVTMAPATGRESAVLAHLGRSGHVSAERVLSGAGLVNLYGAIRALDGATADGDVTPAGVTERALDGSCPFAAEALDMFCAMLGTVASNLCLSLGARGGVYVAGGIVPRLGTAFAESGFRRRFEDKGRFSAHLATVPTFVLTHKMPAFLGLSHLLQGAET